MWQPSILPHVTAWAQSVASNVHVEVTPLHALALVGLVVLLYLAERTLDFVAFHWATPAKPLQGYRRRGPQPTYALITGASAGIGFAVAKALVTQGFGVILLGHKADELAEAAALLRDALVLPPPPGPHDDANATATATAEISRDAYVHTIVMDAVTATPEEMEAQLRTTIVAQGLRVSILVNNVGGMAVAYPPFRELRTYSPSDIDDTINLSARFMARLTALLLPVLTHRGAGVDDHGMSFGTHRRSLVLNVSSAGGVVGTPLLVLYAATKAFNLGFSRALAHEVAMHPDTAHIDVLAVVPGEVRTQGNCVGFAVTAACEADEFGRCLVAKADGAVRRGWLAYRPYWKHHLSDVLMGLASERRVASEVAKVMRVKAAAMNEHYKPKVE